MSEATLWEALKPLLTTMGLDPVRVENVLSPGMPDVNYTVGCLEMKSVQGWPVRGGRVPVEVRPTQVPWLTRRWLRGGPAYVLLRVDRMMLLVPGLYASDLRSQPSPGGLYAISCWWSASDGALRPGDTGRLRSWLTWDCEAMTAPDRALWNRLRCNRTVEQVARELRREPSAVAAAERHPCPLTDDLLAYWES